jgi:phosphoribosyl 1,2-cyclic phosphodiesterase
MYLHIIASGSKGNATLLVCDSTLILIDLGITLKRLKEGLKEINKDFNQIDGAVFTHAHSDHLNGLKSLSPKKMYGTKQTLPSSLSNHINYFEKFNINDVTITAFPTSHDKEGSAGFVFEYKEEKLVYFTDTGTLDDSLIKLLKNPNILMIESNHDIAMLMKTDRSLRCKQRIMSDYGHLSNEDSAFLSTRIIGENTKNIILAHISEEANCPEVALNAYKEVFAFQGIDINKYNIICAPQWSSLTVGNKDEY